MLPVILVLKKSAGMVHRGSTPRPVFPQKNLGQKIINDLTFPAGRVTVTTKKYGVNRIARKNKEVSMVATKICFNVYSDLNSWIDFCITINSNEYISDTEKNIKEAYNAWFELEENPEPIADYISRCLTEKILNMKFISRTKKQNKEENFMSKKLRGVLVDVEKETVSVMEIEDELEELYRILNCTCIDIVVRLIGSNNKKFNIVCDDEALLKGEPKISAIDNDGNPQLCGNLFIVSGKVEDGNLKSLFDAEIAYIMQYVFKISTKKYPAGYEMLIKCNY